MARKTRPLTPRDLERRVAAAERSAGEFLDLSHHRLERRDSSSPERRNTIVRLEQRAIGDDGTIEGYGSVFNVVDDWGDIIVPGAFAATLAAHKAAGTMPAMLWQHRDAEPIGVWTDMVEDSRGLRVKGRLVLEAPRGKEAHALLKAGALNGLSIGFISRKWTWDDKNDERTLQEVDLWEVSPVTFPANVQARVDTVKSGAAFNTINTIRDAERALRDAGLSAEQAKAMVAAVKRSVQVERDADHDAQRAQRAALQLLDTLKRAAA